MRKLDKTETLVTISDMTYVTEVTKLTYIVVYVYTLKRNRNATLFQRKMHGVLFKVLD